MVATRGQAPLLCPRAFCCQREKKTSDWLLQNIKERWVLFAVKPAICLGKAPRGVKESLLRVVGLSATWRRNAFPPPMGMLSVGCGRYCAGCWGRLPSATAGMPVGINNAKVQCGWRVLSVYGSLLPFLRFSSVYGAHFHRYTGRIGKLLLWHGFIHTLVING